MNKPTIKSVLNLRRRNCNEEPATFPTFVLKYDGRDKSKGSYHIIKLFSCGDVGIFSNDKPCVLLLRNGHFYNVWKYEWNHLHVCEGRCIRCLSMTDEHLNDGNSEEGDQITCGDCGQAFLQQFCYRVHKQCELNGPYTNYCDFSPAY